jgi:23S rRNA pseudouridine1911/1915/1917 synthase
VRLDLALIQKHPGLSRRQAREAIEKGQVELDGTVTLEAGSPVGEASRIVWDKNRKARHRVRSSLRILYEDDALLVVDKPAGLLSVPTERGAEAEDTALGRVEEYAARRHPRHPYVGVVHRLDRFTSGALAFALNPVARQGLRTLFREHRIERVYRVLVGGEPGASSGTIDRPIHDSFEGGRRHLARSGDPARPARTHYRVLERLPGASLLEVELDTGRQHQIRLHLASVGLPVLGDRVYGVPQPGAARPMLHALVLGFTHPLTGALVRASSPVPDDFEGLLLSLRKGPRTAPSGPPGAPRGTPGRGPRPGRTRPGAGTTSPSPGPPRRGARTRPGGGSRRGPRRGSLR